MPRDPAYRHRNSGVLLRNNGKAVNVADLAKAVLTDFGDVNTIERHNVIELQSVFGLSALRNVVDTTGSGSVTDNGVEYSLSIAAAGDTAELQSGERARYVPGYIGEMGIAVRVPSDPIGDQVGRWGYFDTQNGFYFGIDQGGLFVGLRRAGVEEVKVYQTDWNADPLDGTGPTGYSMNPANGYIYQIRYSWYGYGTVDFMVMMRDADNEQMPVVVHRYAPQGTVSIDNPNQPITARIEQTNTAQSWQLHVAGRQYGILGRYTPSRRINSERNLSVSVSDGGFIPIISARRKSNFTGVSIKLSGIDILADTDCIIQVRINPSLTGAGFGIPTDTSAAETAVESDTAATSLSGGELIWQQLVGGTNKGSAEQASLPTLDFIEHQPVTVAARTISGNGTVSVVFRWREEW